MTKVNVIAVAILICIVLAFLIVLSIGLGNLPETKIFNSYLMDCPKIESLFGKPYAIKYVFAGSSVSYTSSKGIHGKTALKILGERKTGLIAIYWTRKKETGMSCITKIVLANPMEQEEEILDLSKKEKCVCTAMTTSGPSDKDSVNKK
jgi:hypothetical protein